MEILITVFLAIGVVGLFIWMTKKRGCCGTKGKESMDTGHHHDHDKKGGCCGGH